MFPKEKLYILFAYLMKNNNIKLNPFQIQAIVGSILGDASLGFSKKIQGKFIGNARLVFGYKNQEYANFILNIYLSVCTQTRKLTPFPNPNKGIPTESYFFSTRAFSELTILHSQWYLLDSNLNTFIKKVPLNIYELLTPVGLAIWLMDDGTWEGSGVGIATHSFTHDEVLLLVNVLTNKFGLLCTIQKHKGLHRIYIRAASIPLLRLIVLPHFLPTMLYKLNL